MPKPSGFIVVLPGQIMEIPQDSYLSWLTLFYALPKELVEKRADYLNLPRNIHRLLSNEKWKEMIQTDTFLELVWDCWAWSAWQFFQVPNSKGEYVEIPGDWKNYSGDFPLWRLSYHILPFIRMKFETEMEWSFQRLFLMDRGDELPWLSYQHFSNLVGNITDLIVMEQQWQPMIDEIWKCRQPDDYTGGNIRRRDFMRSWTHERTFKHLSMEEIAENGVKVGEDILFDFENPSAEFETKVLNKLYMEQFLATLSEKDRQILQLRANGMTQDEIAKVVDYKTTGAVSKRLATIAERFRTFAEDCYDDFLNEHTI